MLDFIPVSAIIAVVVIAAIVVFLAVGYVKAPPDMAFIVSGIKKKSKVVIGKATIRIPFFERLDKLNLRLIPIDVKIRLCVLFHQIGELLTVRNHLLQLHLTDDLASNFPVLPGASGFCHIHSVLPF